MQNPTPFPVAAADLVAAWDLVRDADLARDAGADVRATAWQVLRFGYVAHPHPPKGTA